MDSLFCNDLPLPSLLRGGIASKHTVAAIQENLFYKNRQWWDLALRLMLTAPQLRLCPCSSQSVQKGGRRPHEGSKCLAHVLQKEQGNEPGSCGLKGNERDWALSPHKDLFRLYLCRTDLSQSAKNNLSGRGEGKGLGVLCVSDACKRKLCTHGSSILPHGDVTPTVHNPGQLEEKAAHVCISKSFEIIPEPSAQNILGFTMW